MDVKHPKMPVFARMAGLRYVNDKNPGISRRRKGNTFVYYDEKGMIIRAPKLIARLNHLVIPPAWEEVWICPDESGHLQATGRDARGRKQYRYHSSWREVRDETKYHSLLSFGKALPRIRSRVRRDLGRSGLSREKVLATVTYLLETTLIRVGNDEYARENNSFGLTTLRNRHVQIQGEKITFTFRGKSGKQHIIDIKNRRLATIVKRCRDLPGHDLFAYRDESGVAVDITSGDINAYLQEITKQPFTAKHFRTWSGTVLAAQALRELGRFSTKNEAKHNMIVAIENVARALGNTPAICRKCYIHPVILETYLDGTLILRLKKIVEQKLTRELRHLRPDEAAVMMLMQQTLQQRGK